MTSNYRMNFNQYLSQFETPKGEKFTNTSMCYPKKSYHIPDEKYPEFLQKYQLALDDGSDLHLTEKPSQYSPIRIDLDFKFENDNTKDRKYNHQNLEVIISEYCKLLQTHFNTTDITCYLLEKPESSTFRGKIKDGVHIIFPDIKLSYDLQHFIRDNIIKNPTVIQEFKNMHVINSISDIVDKAVISQNVWFLYGSKKLESHSYLVTKVYQYTSQLLQSNLTSEKSFVQYLSMRNTLSDNSISIKDDKKYIFDEYLKKNTKKIDNNPKTNNNILKFKDDDTFILAKKLVNECLSIDRVDSYDDWSKLGWCLRNIDERLLDTWIEFSKNSSKFKDGACENIWVA